MLFPIEIIARIVQYLPLIDGPKTAVAMCPGISVDEVRRIKNQKRNLVIFLHDIASVVPQFMDLIDATDMCVIGLRAFSFFHCIDLDPSYAWSFVSNIGIVGAIVFIDHLEHNGVIWKISSHDTGTECAWVTGKLFAHGYTINIKVSWTTTPHSMTSEMSELSVTPLQCIVSNHKCIDPYGKLHAKKMYRVWGSEYRPNDTTNRYVREFTDLLDGASFKPILYHVHRQPDPYIQTFRKYLHMQGRDSILYISDTNSRGNDIGFIGIAEDPYNVTFIASKRSGISLYIDTTVSYLRIKSQYPQLQLKNVDQSFNTLHQNLYCGKQQPIIAPSWARQQEWERIIDGRVVR